MGGNALELAPSAATTKAQADHVLNVLQAEIHAHEKEDDRRSYLDMGLDFIWRSDENSHARLKSMEKNIQQELKQEHFDAVAKMRDEVEKAIKDDQSSRSVQNNVSFYGGTALKVGALFYGGKIGWGATAGFYALDAAHPGDEAYRQMIDLGLGATKGLAYKGLVTGLMDSALPLPAKGLAMSLGGRGLDTLLTSDNYYDRSGKFSITNGLMATGKEMIDLRHLAVDGAVMGVAFGVGYGVNRLFGQALTNSPLYSRIATSGIAGVSRGAIAEMSAMRAAGEAFSFERVAGRGLLMGTVYALAAVPGAIQADHQYHQQLEKLHQNQHDVQNAGTDASDNVQFQEFKKVGTVRAQQLKAPESWTTSKGETMQAAAGDWKITGSDGSSWSVKPEIFAQTYSPVDGSPGMFAKTAITRATQLTQPITIKTLEGQGSGQPGDYLVRGPAGEEYIVSKAKFESMYVPVKPDGTK